MHFQVKFVHFQGGPWPGTEEGCTGAWLVLSAPELLVELAETLSCLHVGLRLFCSLMLSPRFYRHYSQ